MSEEDLFPVDIRITPRFIHPDFEVVERKGLGHPDTLADAIAEAISIDYSRHCLREFGVVLHHNIDKLAILGGHFVSDFGTCDFRQPVTVLLNGRMSSEFGGVGIDIPTLCERAAKRILGTQVPKLDLDEHVRFFHHTTGFSKYATWFQPKGLDDLPEHKTPTASDSMVTSAWWPLSTVEGLVLELERSLGSWNTPSMLGTDVKVLAVRKDQMIDCVMNVPFLSGDVHNYSDYFDLVLDLKKHLTVLAHEFVGDAYNVRFRLNRSSSNPFNSKKAYVLGIGSCIECGEEGVVGRGNDAQGLISVHRPRSMEAPFGKNPVYHAGKVYTAFARKIAREVAESTGASTEVTIVSQHSDPLRKPWRVDVSLKGRAVDRDCINRKIAKAFETWDYLGALVEGEYLMPSRNCWPVDSFTDKTGE